MSPTRSVARCLDIPTDDHLRFLPEGPTPLPSLGTADAGEQSGAAVDAAGFSWVAIQHGADATVGSLNIHRFDTGQSESYGLPGRPGFAFPTDRSGVYIIGCERQIGLFDIAKKSWSVLADGVDSDVDNTIINDGMTIGQDLIFGCKELEFKTKKAGLYLFRGRDSSLVKLRDDQICSNGKAVLSRDGDVVEFSDIDSPSRQIVRRKLDVASGSLDGGEVIVDFEGDPAVPDGQTLTPDGRHLIVAMFRPEVAAEGETRMYDVASGNLVHTWTTPGSPQNTCPVLLTRQGKTHLVITTAIENLNADDVKKCPNAGRIFIAETDLAPADTPVHRLANS